MRPLLLIRSIPLSAETKAAWHHVLGVFIKRSRDLATVEALDYMLILNLGNSEYVYPSTTPGKVWNEAHNIRPLLNPELTRSALGQYLPDNPVANDTDFWIKGPGRGGINKSRITGTEREFYQSNPPGYDDQVHIEGTEYRVVTVGDRVVQQHKRTGVENERVYTWLPADSLPTGLRPMVKSAAENLGGHNVIAWDTIVDEDGRPFILEGNTSPGLNEYTAERIRDEMERQYEELNNA